MLILFDIDMTLITTSGSGMKAMLEAGRELYGPVFTTEGISFAGRLDPLIITDMLAKVGVADTQHEHRRMRAAYAQFLERRLREPGIGRALPGVMALLAALEQRGGLALGLLTGNYEETGSMKLRACGIEPSRFEVRVWGDESPSRPPRREDLVPVGMERWSRLTGRRPHARDVVVIGDTPHDVRCAKTHGCRSLAVATGYTSREDLDATGADVTMTDLSATDEVMAWLLGATEPARP